MTHSFFSTLAALPVKGRKTRASALAVAMFGISAFTQGEAKADIMQVVISQIYGGGSNSGATFNHDFIELYNNGTTAVTLTGDSLQYATATTTVNFNSITALSGTIAAGGYFLVQEAGATSPGAALPTPDQTSSSINMATTGGKIVLALGTTALSSTSATGTNVVDFVGWGSTANASEGSSPAASMGSNTASLTRKTTITGYQDTNVNSADYLVAGTATPHNSASTFTLSANFSVSVSTVTANDNLLLGAPASDFAGTATVTNNGGAAGSYAATSTGVTGLTLSGDTSDPSVGAGASTVVNYVPTTTPSTYGTATSILTITPGTGSAINTTISYFVGNASANNSNSSTTFGSFTYFADIADGNSYAGLASRVTSTSGTGGAGSIAGTVSTSNPGTTATILDGTNTTGGVVTFGEDYRTRTTSEASLLVSDVLKLTSTAGQGGSAVAPGTFVLELTDVPGSSSAPYVLSELVGGVWGNAVLNNAGGTPTNEGAVAYDPSLFQLGDYGYDPANNVAWAVIDHAGTFAVAPSPSEVPEPASLALLGLGGAGLLLRRRRS